MGRCVCRYLERGTGGALHQRSNSWSIILLTGICFVCVRQAGGTMDVEIHPVASVCFDPEYDSHRPALLQRVRPPPRTHSIVFFFSHLRLRYSHSADLDTARQIHKAKGASTTTETSPSKPLAGQSSIGSKKKTKRGSGQRLSNLILLSVTTRSENGRYQFLVFSKFFLFFTFFLSSNPFESRFSDSDLYFFSFTFTPTRNNCLC